MSNLRSVFSQNEDVATRLRQFALDVAAPAAEKLGWDFKPDEDYLTVQLRKLLIMMAGLAGHEGQVYLFKYTLFQICN